MHKYNRGVRHRSFMSNAMHQGREFLRGTDHFVRTWGPSMKNIAQFAAPAVASYSAPLAAGIAAVGQAADGYSQLRSQLGD